MAIVAAIVAFIAVVLTSKQMNQKNIDASLKASARIEWIQKVRNTTAELISSYY